MHACRQAKQWRRADEEIHEEAKAAEWFILSKNGQQHRNHHDDDDDDERVRAVGRQARLVEETVMQPSPSSSASSSSSSKAEKPLQATPLPEEPATKPAPSPSQLPFTFRYSPAPGSQAHSNLVILFPGLGDTARSFSSLGSTLQKILPQTCVLTIQGRKRIPLLPEEAWQYWDVVTSMGEMLPPVAQNPSRFLADFSEMIEALTEQCQWPREAIHLFGFAMGGTAAMEGVISWSSSSTATSSSKGTQATDSGQMSLGSVVSICGPLISHPTLSRPLNTPLLYFRRPPPPPPSSSSSTSTTTSSKQQALLAKTFTTLQVLSHPTPTPQGSMGSELQVQVQVEGIEAMPRGKEWDDIMAFWSSSSSSSSSTTTAGDHHRRGGKAKMRNRSKWEVQAQSRAQVRRGQDGREDADVFVLSSGAAGNGDCKP